MTNIEKIRKENNLTQKELAMMIGVNVGLISRLENKQETPSSEVLKSLAEVFKCSPEKFY